MRKALLIARHEFFVTLSRPSFRIFSALVPVLAVLGLGTISVYQTVRDHKPEDAIQAGVIDLTVGQAGDPLFTSYRQQDNVTFVLMTDPQAATRRLIDGDIDKLYVISENYLHTGLINEIKPEQAGIGGISEASGNPNQAPLGRFLLNNLFVGEVGPDRAQRVLDPFTIVTTEVSPDGSVVVEDRDLGRLLFFIGLGVMLVVSVFTTSGYLLQGLNEEKENRIMEVLLSSAKPEHLMIGKLLGLGGAGLLQMLVWTASGLLFLVALTPIIEPPKGLDLTPPPLAIIVGAIYFVLGYFFFGTLMAALGAITTSTRESGQVTAVVVLPGVAPLWFMEQMIENPEGPLARAASFIPFSAPLASLVRLGVDGMGLLDLVISVVLLAGSVVLAMWLTIRLFRAYLLMYGQRPGFRQILRTLRNA
ncbi:MAG: ABC transporter permease [Chloroflexi bacterium]|nr:ABC transporter permease [Chloroflexota bacterium]MDA1173135.1 ABC transporter permease [Chloroflexota bacterium]